MKETFIWLKTINSIRRTKTGLRDSSEKNNSPDYEASTIRMYWKVSWPSNYHSMSRVSPYWNLHPRRGISCILQFSSEIWHFPAPSSSKGHQLLQLHSLLMTQPPALHDFCFQVQLLMWIQWAIDQPAIQSDPPWSKFITP